MVEVEAPAGELDLRAARSMVTATEMTVDELVAQTQKVQDAMRRVMIEGEHYGTIPGTQKPTLYKAGAEKLNLLFRFEPDYDIQTKTETDDLVSYTVKCTLIHIPTGNRIASGMGQANSREGKYRYRLKPEPNIEYKDAEALKEQGLGAWKKIGKKWVFHLKIENDNAMDQANTLLKMACKRALVAAVLNGTGASDIFTQDLEDMAPQAPEKPPATDDTLDAMVEMLDACAALDASLWGLDVVLPNARRRFGREIRAITDLQEDEALQILAGAAAWHSANQPIEGPEDDPVTTNEVEEEDEEAQGDGNGRNE